MFVLLSNPPLAVTMELVSEMIERMRARALLLLAGMLLLFVGSDLVNCNNCV
jgi:hypothetical protein